MMIKVMRRGLIGACLLFLLCFAGIPGSVLFPGGGLAGDFTLTILHLNDTHSHLDATWVSHPCGEGDLKTELGGFPRLATAVRSIREKGQPLLFLHGGDMVRGSLYFTRYGGRADVDLLNAIGLDAATLGNHDFDQGPEVVSRLMEKASFPFVSANIDASREPSLAGKIKPYIIRSFDGKKVAVIGVTTPSTAYIAQPGDGVSFGKVVPRVAAAVREVQAKGVEKIIVLSHIGYDEDLRLARTVAGIDVIVGGHSHTLLGRRGDFCRRDGLCLTPSGDYPTVVRGPEGKTVLVVQAWEWGKLLGNLEVSFDVRGDVTAWRAQPVVVAGDSIPGSPKGEKRGETLLSGGSEDGGTCLPPRVRQYEKDPHVQERLDVYATPLNAFRHTSIATSEDDCKRRAPFGPGRLVAESMLWKTRFLGTRAALQNAGGVRCDMPAGEITIGMVYEILPFDNTLHVIDLTGSQLHRTVEELIRAQMRGRRGSGVYTAGLTFHVKPGAPFGKRVTGLRIRKDGDGGYERVRRNAVYRIAVQDYLARGGDGCKTLAGATRYRQDTGFVDAEVFIEYLRQIRGVVACPAGKR
ncbi:MAG: hypothetical protein GX147_08565 [Deltaproteobacteria bacterium]|nr:hypothetical protein [Deltaproteobacteria bacterium]